MAQCMELHMAGAALPGKGLERPCNPHWVYGFAYWVCEYKDGRFKRHGKAAMVPPPQFGSASTSCHELWRPPEPKSGV